MQQMSISQARSLLTKMPNLFRKDSDPIEVANRGVPVLAILPWVLYESMEETLAIVSDEKLMRKIKKSLRQVKLGKTVSWETVKKNLKLK
ncbi:MAG: type II toxin-antitoxin system Phd/YefM family antitoxin [Elusimicrobiota bacterium]